MTGFKPLVVVILNNQSVDWIQTFICCNIKQPVIWLDSNLYLFPMKFEIIWPNIYNSIISFSEKRKKTFIEQTYHSRTQSMLYHIHTCRFSHCYGLHVDSDGCNALQNTKKTKIRKHRTSSYTFNLNIIVIVIVIIIIIINTTYYK